MKDIKKLKDIPDMERYLQDDCYCPGEIYSLDGFFFKVFDKENDCKFIGEADENNILTKSGYRFISVLCKANKEDDVNILIICINKDNKICDIIRFDATENNINLIKEVCKNNKTDKKFNEFKEDSTTSSLEKIMEIADAIIVD